MWRLPGWRGGGTSLVRKLRSHMPPGPKSKTQNIPRTVGAGGGTVGVRQEALSQISRSLAGLESYGDCGA